MMNRLAPGRNPVSPTPSLSTAIAPLPGSWAAAHDARWPVVAAALERLRDEGRHAVRIVDADCGAGAVLLHAVHHARSLGFTAIEGRGIDGSPTLIGRARAAAARSRDRAIGVEFDLADMATALREEYELPADIILWHGSRDRDRPSDVTAVLALAGNIVIDDRTAACRGGAMR